MPKKHKLEQIGEWAKENNLFKWLNLHPDEINRKKAINLKGYQQRKRNVKNNER